MYLAGEEVTMNPRNKGWKEALVRKGYLTHDNQPTLQGKAFYEALQNTDDVVNLTKVIKETRQRTVSSFDAWWECYPATDRFTVGSKEFKNTRTLRSNKDKCKEIFNRIINSGEYTAEEIIEATKMDVLARKEASMKGNDNKVTFMNKSEVYLNQKAFDAYVEMYRNGERPGEVSGGQSRVYTL